MSAVQYNNSGSAADRRRRRLVVEMDPQVAETDANSQANTGDDDSSNSAFPMLSRDRLIRRIISPRLWKHVTVAIVLTFVPIIFEVATWPSTQTADVAADATFRSQLDFLRGLSGLKLFVAAQFCMVIGWVRSASVVDFRGRYRWWRWMAIGLFAASFVLLTGSTEFFENLAVSALQPVFGTIDSARPALLIVPTGAGLALILRRLIPDMGRCRLSQSLVACSTMLLIVRAIAGARLNSPTAVFHLTTIELLISGLLLSAFQLHARYVIHVNPNPPVTIERKVLALPTHSEIVNAATNSVDTVQTVAEQSKATVSEIERVASRESSAKQTVSLPVLNPPDLTAYPATFAAKSVEEATQSAPQLVPQAKHKSNKKQKLRKAG